MINRTFLIVVAAVLFALSATAGAITIVNPGFESPVMADGAYQYNPDGWTQIGSDGGGVWNLGSGAYGGIAPEGEQVGYVEAWGVPYPTGLAQILAETLTADTQYELTVQVGNNTYYTSGDYVIELLAGGTVLNSFGENAEANITDDTFALKTVVYDYDVADAGLVGQPLEIRLYLTAGGEVDFDDVQLIPEPATIGLLGMGALALIRRKRK